MVQLGESNVRSLFCKLLKERTDSSYLQLLSQITVLPTIGRCSVNNLSTEE